MFHSLKKYSLSFLFVLLFLTGCASIPTDYPRTESTAFQNYKLTTAGRLFETVAVKHRGKSGFYLLPDGQDSLTARIAMVDMAEKSLDLQYYLWKPDSSGTLLAYRIIKAADRGVRVRVLLDDIGLSGKDAIIASMDAHPNIQIRLFNPFPHRKYHAVDFLSDFAKLNRRMHNKTIVADNAVAIVGGRNIGDHYFGVAKDGNWRDLDIAASGPVVREISHVVDYFWNGDWSVPIAVLAKQAQTRESLTKLTQAMQKKINNADFPYSVDDDVKLLRSKLLSIRDNFIWASGRYVWNDPKTMKLKARYQQGTMIQKLKERVKTVRESLHIESAYLVPRDSGISALKHLHDRGVTVQILTNSLVSNDVLAAHAGYAAYRKKMLNAGVELYELRPDAGKSTGVNVAPEFAKLKAGLHAKAMVFDEESLFVGSFNLDPRSAAINTEGGLYVESSKLAKQLVTFMNDGISPENSYKVVLDKKGGLDWLTEMNGKPVIHYSEPKVGLWQRFKAGFIQVLPLELQL